MHRLNQRLDVPPLCLGPAQAPLRVPGIPLVLFPLQIVRRQVGAGAGALHDAVYVALHRLFVETIEAHSVWWRWSGRPRLGDLLDGVEGMDKDAID